MKKENNPRWKGDGAGYMSKHQFLKRNFGNPQFCYKCGIKGKEEKDGRWSIHWALKKDKEYSHEIDDYQGLCRCCHGKYDMTDERREHLRNIAKGQKGSKSINKSLVAKARLRDRYGHFIKATA